MCPQVQQQTESPRIIRDEGRAAIAAGRGRWPWIHKKNCPGAGGPRDSLVEGAVTYSPTFAVPSAW